jgi:ABC-type transporter Mla MlaB component
LVKDGTNAVVGKVRRFHNVMLRIRVDDQPPAATLYVEGKLVGRSVDELRKVWTAIHSELNQKQTVVELTSLLLVDAAGRSLLRQMHAKGAQLSGSGLMIRTLIEEIANGKNSAGESAFLLTREN